MTEATIHQESQLHKLANILAKRNLEANIEASVDTLKFLKEIDFKTEQDFDKIDEAKKVLELLQSDEYFQAVRNAFAEHYAKMPAKFIARYLEEIEYETAIAEVGLTLVPALYKLRDDFFYGPLEKRTLQ